MRFPLNFSSSKSPEKGEGTFHKLLSDTSKEDKNFLKKIHSKSLLVGAGTGLGLFRYTQEAAIKAGVSTQAWIWLKLVDFFSPIVKRNIWTVVRGSKHLQGGGFWHWHRPKVNFHQVIFNNTKIFITTPKEGAETPIHILYLHGGDFVMDVMPYYGWMLSDLAEKMSCTVHMPFLPLAPKHTWRETMDLIIKGYEHLVEQHGAENVVVMGDSAGGWLSVTLAREIARLKLEKPRCLVLYSPFLDLSCTGEGQDQLAKVDPILDIPFLRKGGQMWIGDLNPKDPEINPIMAKDLDGLPPTIIFSGTRDILNSDARRLKEKEPWMVLEQYYGMPHIFVVGKYIPEAHQALKQTADFIRNPHRASTKEEMETLRENSRGESWRLKIAEADPTKNEYKMLSAKA
ncbi:alpha/beta hydrolase [Acetobacteraceae bacterium]|nr:alpha/beta hydrolase [Acetobacteraceae bacterium]